MMKLAKLSNEELLSGLHALLGQGRVLLARLLAYLSEIEERRLDLQSACSSLFDFCVRRLGMGDDEAYRRIAASRLTRRYPLALAMIERGEIHMTALLLLRDYLTAENHEELLRAAVGKTKAQVQELLAARFPRPDAPSRMPRLNEPLSPERYKVQFTASEELKQKLEHAVNLTRHANPNGDLAVLVEQALDLLIAKLEKRRFGATKRPAAKPPCASTRPGYVTSAVRREVFARDGARCTFVDGAGRRCESRGFLELDHVKARALGGGDDASNIRLRCARHNALSAERDFGREHIERRKAESKSNHPLQRGNESERALRALIGMGFKERQARHALAIIAPRWTDRAPPLETVLRETLSILT